MTTILKTLLRPRQFGNVPYGNLAYQHYSLESNASGVVIPSDLATAAQIGDIVDLGPIQGGASLIDSLIRVSTAFTASVTASLGFKYADGVDDANVPQDAAYFGAGITIATVGTYRNATSKKLLAPLPKEARLILTIAGAAFAKAAYADIFIFLEHGKP